MEAVGGIPLPPGPAAAPPQDQSFYAAYLDKDRAYHATEACRKAIRKRKVWMEPLFAKDWRGLQRFRLRGLANANIEGLLVTASQSLKRWLAAIGWGRRYAPCGSLMALSGRNPVQVNRFV